MVSIWLLIASYAWLDPVVMLQPSFILNVKGAPLHGDQVLLKRQSMSPIFAGQQTVSHVYMYTLVADISGWVLAPW